MLKILVNADVYQQAIKEVDAERKIAAIKLVRNNGSIASGGKIGLKEAKWAIESLFAERFSSRAYNIKPQAKLCPLPKVKNILVDFGGGEVVLDLEAMELRVLTELNTIGINECGRLLDLCHAIKLYDQGLSITSHREED